MTAAIVIALEEALPLGASLADRREIIRRAIAAMPMIRDALVSVAEED
jgi:hypothetical protein